jgi:hypothetical protein
MLVSASRRNELSRGFMAGLIEYVREVRDGEDAIASMRDARAPQKRPSAKSTRGVLTPFCASG